MTSDQLNRLFESARKIPVETSSEDIATWVSIAAASSTGVLGTFGKLKLLIAKKSMIMMGTTLSIVTAGIITVVSINSSDPVKKTTHSEPLISKENVTGPNELVEKTEQAENGKTTEFSVNSHATQKENRMKSMISYSPVAALSIGLNRTFEIPRYSLVNPVSFEAPRYDDTTKKRKVKASGNVIKKEYKVEEFTKLYISGIFDVVLIQGDEAKVEFEADDNLQEFLIAESKGGTLSLDFAQCNISDKKGNTVYVTFKDLQQLEFIGVGDIKTEGSVKLASLNCEVSGVGDLIFEMECSDLTVNFSGVGDITLKGSGSKANYQWSGVGDLKAKELLSKEVSLQLSGVGDASLNATEKLEVELSGLGDVKYTGSPKSTTLNTSGLGEIQGS